MATILVGQAVIDKTRTTGKFDIHLEFAPDTATRRFLAGGDLANQAGPATGSSIFAAMRQLGLKLEPAQGPREFLVIDHVERPTGN